MDYSETCKLNANGLISTKFRTIWTLTIVMHRKLKLKLNNCIYKNLHKNLQK